MWTQYCELMSLAFEADALGETLRLAASQLDTHNAGALDDEILVAKRRLAEQWRAMAQGDLS
jgi:hypothetical protein